MSPAGRVFRPIAPRSFFQGLHERGPKEVLDEGEPAHDERPGQHGDLLTTIVTSSASRQMLVLAGCRCCSQMCSISLSRCLAFSRVGQGSGGAASAGRPHAQPLRGTSW